MFCFPESSTISMFPLFLLLNTMLVSFNIKDDSSKNKEEKIFF